jgi:hypothetical protein
MFEGPSTSQVLILVAILAAIIIGTWELAKFFVSHMTFGWQ